MKTAMKQLKNDILIELKLGYITEHSATRILNYIDDLYLEEEKKQIIQAYEVADINNYDSKKFPNITPEYLEICGKEYYEKHYNNENTNNDSRL